MIEPSDLYSEVEEKVRGWLESGVRLVVVVEPKTKTVKVHRSFKNIQILTKEDTLEGGEVVPGWTLSLSELFATL